MEIRVFDIHKVEEPRGFRLAGELDIAGEAALTRALAAETGCAGDLTLDLSALTFIDSVGVQALIKAAEDLQEDGRLILQAPGKIVRKVFELMRLDTVPNVQVTRGEMPEEERT
jgi:anti-anti-sigma factor